MNKYSNISSSILSLPEISKYDWCHINQIQNTVIQTPYIHIHCVNDRFLCCRIDWLNKGSRALFGTVIEDQIYILIDTSASMLPSIQYLKDKLFLLMQVRNNILKQFVQSVLPINYKKFSMYFIRRT